MSEICLKISTGQKHLIKEGGGLFIEIGEKIISFQELCNALSEICDHCGKNQLVELILIASEARKKRFARHDDPKYGDRERWIPADLLIELFQSIEEKKERFKYALLFQLAFGISPGQIVEMNLSQLELNPEIRRFNVMARKSGKPRSLKIPFVIYPHLLQYVEKFQDKIQKNNGYLFFSDSIVKKHEHWTAIYYRMEFARIREKIPVLNQNYGYSESHYSNVKPRVLKLYTPHCLRHTFAKLMLNKEKNVELVQKLLGHKRLETTQIYIKSTQKEMDNAMEVSNPLPALL